MLSESGSVGALAVRHKTQYKGPKCYSCLSFGHIQRNCPECTRSSVELKSSEHLKPIRKGKKGVKNKVHQTQVKGSNWSSGMSRSGL